MAGGLVTLRMRPMRAWLLGPMLGLALIPVCFGETRLSFLPIEPVSSIPVPAGMRTVYAWEGHFFEDLPKIQAEMREHGYRAQICLSAGDCAAAFYREDGTVVRVSAARWITSETGGYADNRFHDHLVATIEEPTSLIHWWNRLRSSF